MRNPEYERQFLEHVAHAAKQSGEVEEFFANAVRRRLDKGAEEYEDSAFTRPFDELLANAAEEGEDVPAWLVLALQRPELRELPDEAAQQVRFLLMEASAEGMRLWTRVSIARRIVAEHLGADEPDPISGD